MSLELSGTTGVKGVAGSVSAPSIVGDDTNTGISFPSADTIKFSTGGVERMSITNSGISGITQGLTEVDSWRITSTLSNYGDNFITANWERTDTYFEKIGTGLTESSGVFSFPSTGKYLLMYKGQATGNSDNYIGIKSYLTVNNGSSYISINENYGSAYNGGANTYASFGLMDIVDITDISNYKWKYMASSSGTVNYHGLTSQSRNGFTVYKLGET